MNNFFVNQDPLLFRNTYSSPYDTDTESEMRQQLDDALIQYRNAQQRPMPQNAKDYLGELDILLKNLNGSTVEFLNSNEEYQRLNAELQGMIQQEIMSSVKWRLNNNSSAIKNIQHQREIIENANKMVQAEERKSLSELNDYVKNYSNITFDEYKRIKNGNNDESKRIQIKTDNNG